MQSEYEKLREENMRKNEEFLLQLGLAPSSTSEQAPNTSTLQPTPLTTTAAAAAEGEDVEEEEDDVSHDGLSEDSECEAEDMDEDDVESDGEESGSKAVAGSASAVTTTDLTSEEHPMQAVEGLMRRLFGHVKWRPGQEWAIDRVIRKERGLLCAPTGDGPHIPFDCTHR